MKKLRRLLQNGDFQIALFCFGLVVFVWPFLGTFLSDSPNHLFLYLFVAWGVIIALHFLASNNRPTAENKSEQESGE